MDLKAKIQETKDRKKAFLKEMPEEQRRLLQMYGRAKRAKQRTVTGIAVAFVLFAVLYLVLSIALPYKICWMWNGIIAGVLFIAVTVLLLLLRSSYRKKADAYASTIADFTKEYDRLDDRLQELKKAERDRVRSERKAQNAQRKAEVASERAAEQVRAAEAYASDTRQKAQEASAAADKLGSDGN